MTPKEWAEQYRQGWLDAEKYIAAYGRRPKYEMIYGPYSQGYNDRMDCPEGKC